VNRGKFYDQRKSLNFYQFTRKTEEFQTTKIPPDAPTEGEKAKV
jgi:hypothetical protein